MSPGNGSPDINDLVQRAADLVRNTGRPRVADGILHRLNARARPHPSVLVAGEDKRGKSTLVNALLGEADLSPVGVEVVTGAPISFFHSPKRRAAIVRYGEQTPVPTEFDQARALATVEGNPGNEANIRAVQIGLPHPLLQQVLLVDTPGVGGLASGHGELTLQTLTYADSLIFVLEAGAQIRAAELEFLKRASARIDTVILVLTKIDLHRGWRTILEDNLRILREQAPRFADCPVVPVSSLLALRATRTDDPEDAAAMREESGIARLAQAIAEHVVDRADVLGRANVLRETLAPLAVAERSCAEKLAALESGGTAQRGLEAEQERLRQLSSDKADWPRRLDTDVRKITLRRQEDVNRGLVEIRRRYDERLKDPSKKDRESMPGELTADLTALAGRVNEASATQLTDLINSMIDDIDSASELHESIAALTADHLTGQLATVGMGSTNLNKYDKISLLSSFSSGKSLGTLVTGGGLGLTAGTLIAPPIGIAIGLGLGAVYAYTSFRGRSRSAFQSEFKGWMMEQCNQTQSTVNTTFMREVIDIQDEMRSLVRDALMERETQINRSLKESKRLLEAETAQQEKAGEQLRRRHERAQHLQQRVNAALTALGAPER